MLLLVGGLSGSTSPDASLGFSVVETDGAERWPTLLLAAQCVLRQNPETGFPSLLDFLFSVINMRPRKIHPFILWNLAVVGNMCQTPIVQLKLTNDWACTCTCEAPHEPHTGGLAPVGSNSLQCAELRADGCPKPVGLSADLVPSINKLVT